VGRGHTFKHVDATASALSSVPSVNNTLRCCTHSKATPLQRERQIHPHGAERTVVRRWCCSCVCTADGMSVQLTGGDSGGWW
jgi:hypothetical protein